MAERILPFGQVTPTARPIGAFVQPGEQNTAAPARPVELPAARGIDTLQISGTTNVQGFNQFEQLATALAPFSRQLMKTAEFGYEDYAKGKIEEGYYKQLKNQAAKATLSLQPQAETGAADAASQIGQLQKTDPEAAQLLKEANPWVLIGRRRAVAQKLAADVDTLLENDLSNNAGMLAQLQPGDPAIKARQIDLIQKQFGRYGLTGDEPEVNFYVTPAVNKASEAYAEKQRKLYRAALEDSTKGVTTASISAKVQFMLTRPVIMDGKTYALGSPEWREANAYVLTDELDRQLRLLDPEERKRTIDHIRREVGGIYSDAGPFAAQLIRSIRGGDPSMPYEKRPTWGAMAPLEMLELQVRGQKAVQENYSLGQQTIEQRLNSAWYGTPEQRGPGSLDPLDPSYPAALLQFRNQALGMGYANPEEFIAKRAKSQGEFTEAVRPPDPFLAEDFVAQIRNISPSAWTDDPNAFANAQQQARQIASREPNRQAQRDTYQRLMGEIEKAQSAAGELGKGVIGFVENQVMQDLDSDAVRQIRDKQKVNGQQGSALAQLMQQRRAGGATATEAVASVYQNTKLTAFANQTRELYIRAVSKAMNDWKTENPGRSLGPAQQSVVMSEAAVAVRKSPQYERLVQQLTGRKPGQVGPGTVGPGKVGTDPRNARGVPREAARNLSDDQIRTVDRRPVMNARWVYSELQQLQRGKPFSAELNNLARRANTTPLRYLQQNLRYWRSDLDPQGEVMRYLDDRIRREKPARTVAGNQISSILPDGLGGWDPLAAGGWLMGMIAPPAAAATMPPGLGRAPQAPVLPSGGDTAALGRGMGGLLALIRSGEGGWNSVNRGGAGDTPGGIGAITNRPIGSLIDMQNRRQVFAVGAYQFTPGVLARAMREAGLPSSAPFTPENQNRMAVALITGSKRPDLAAYIRGESNNLNAAHREIALEWAALQGPNGRGMYDGDKAGNRASVSASKVRALLQQARQEYLSRRRA